MFDKAAITTLTAVGRFADMVRAGRAQSLVEYVKMTRVEPIVLMDETAMGFPFTSEVLQSTLNIFAGYYLQAITLSVNVGRVDAMRLLDRVNPTRDPVDNAAMTVGHFMMSEESYKYALPVPGLLTGLEAYGDDAKVEEMSATTGRDVGKVLSEASDLSVGKLLEVNVECDGQKATFPVAVRLVVTPTSRDSLIHILSIGSKNTSVKERFYGWKANQLTFVRDLMLCQDLIDDHRAALMKDTTGQYLASAKRADRNKLSAIISGQPSVATASSIVVISKTTAAQLEGELGGRLSSFAIREKLFKSTYTMLLLVLDDEWERVTVYTRSIDSAATFAVKEMKAANKKGGTDVAEVLRAYQLGNSPSI
jgi:hypothetical protein